VAHDFNNRLLIIMGYAQMLQRDLPAGNPLLDHVEMVLGSAQRAAELTHQLLAYSRHQVLKPEVFDLSQAVEDMRSMLGRLIGEDIELVTVCSAHHPIHSDRGQIEQVLLNLVVNARDAMPTGGRLTLETRDTTLEANNDAHLPPGDYVSLILSDTGSGIEAAVLPHIFEPFFTTKEVGKGSGLGLSMVEGVVSQSGGSVTARSELGRGATFTVHLPRSRQVSTSIPREPASSITQRTTFETVLVCDDDEDVRKLLVQVLAFRGYQTLQATSGRHALEIAREHDGPIHMLVTDVVMPELGGLELAETLRGRYPGLKVLFVSGYTDDSNRFSGSLGPNTLFLAKPFLPAELTECARALLETQGARSASG
jgi:CheY-like chemotaxis protein